MDFQNALARWLIQKGSLLFFVENNRIKGFCYFVVATALCRRFDRLKTYSRAFSNLKKARRQSAVATTVELFFGRFFH